MSKKIIICGKGNETHLALYHASKILSADWEVIYCYIKKEQIACDNMNYAKQLGMTVFPIIDSITLLDQLKKTKPDYLLFTQFSIIIKADMIDFMSGNIINLHHGALPKYRGVGPITHAILLGETQMGTTLHFVDTQIDTGDIIEQEIFSIKGKTNEESYQLCQQADAKIIKNFLTKLNNNQSFSRIKQDKTQATYYSFGTLCYDNPVIDCNQSAIQIQAFARAYFFPSKDLYPKIITGGVIYRLLEIPEILERNIGTKAGVIVEDKQGLRISSKDCWLFIRKYEKLIA
ncbi:MAG: hypothetical protein K0U45_01070 [Alphaproteobacteria bacterium]|nr:hypothetical protein [Alphaproteobacteria bacterium]